VLPPRAHILWCRYRWWPVLVCTQPSPGAHPAVVI